MPTQPRKRHTGGLSRREFLKFSAAAGAGAALLAHPLGQRAAGWAAPWRMRRGPERPGSPTPPAAPAAPDVGVLGPNSLIRSTFGQGNFEAVIQIGGELWHYFHDNSNVDLPWTRGQRIADGVTGPASIIQSSFGADAHPGNFEVVVLKGNELWHYWHDNSDVNLPWGPGQRISDRATGPGSIIQSDFGGGTNKNFEVVVPEADGLWHYFHDNSDVNLPWTRAQRISDRATGPGCIIQGNFGSTDHGNFEVVVQEGNELWHHFHDNSDVNLPWTRGQRIATFISGGACIIQGDFGSTDHGNFEVVVPEGNNLVHYFHDNSDVNLPWTRAQIITTSASGPATLIQGTLGSGTHKNFEVLARECSQSVVHYWHPNQDVNLPWQRGQLLLGESAPPDMPWTRKVVQLVGEYDREGWNGVGTPPYAFNRTASRFGIRGTDLGSSFSHKGKLFFLFGDTWRGTNGLAPQNDDLDSIAYTTDPAAYDGIELTFNPQPPLVYENGGQISQDAFDVPMDGFSYNNTMYVFFSTDTYFVEKNAIMGRTVLARARDDFGLNFDVVYTLSRYRFINVTVQMVSDSRSQGLPGDGLGLLIWGSGRYRASDVFLAFVPLAQVEDRNAVQFFAGIGLQGGPVWSFDENQAAPLICNGSVGELCVRWSAILNRWLMTYNSGNPRGILLQRAAHPWGPWSPAEMLFNPGNGYCQFMHRPGCDHVDDQMFGGDRSGEYGGEYGPYQVSQYATGVRGSYSKIYFALSTWNPYSVMQMSAVVPAENQVLDPNAYAYSVAAASENKFARLATLMATLAAQHDLGWQDPLEASQSSADHIEWGLFNSIDARKAALKGRFATLLSGLGTNEDKADAYAKVAVDMIILGGGASGETADYNTLYAWAFNNLTLPGSEGVVTADIDRRVDSTKLLEDVRDVFLPLVRGE